MSDRWIRKFHVAFAGLFWAIGDQNSFIVHGVVSALTLLLAAALGLASWQWVALILAIGGVWTAELLNTSIELLVKVLHPEHDQRIGRVLDVAAAAVLVASLTAVVVGLVIFVPAIYELVVAGAAPA